MFHYQAFGLAIQSEIELPELIRSRTGIDLKISLDPRDGSQEVCDDNLWVWQLTPEAAEFRNSQIGHFQVLGGREIRVTPGAAATVALIRTYILGTMLAVALYQRGRLVLHASAVDLQGEVVAFIGESGWGKSSMAAALHAQGHTLVADDLAPVDLDAEPPCVAPGYPQIKLTNESAAALGIPGEQLVELHPTEGKRGCRLTDGFARDTLPLRAIYVLAYGPEQNITPLRPQEAVVELIRHSYPSRLLVSGGAAHLRQCARLVATVPIYRLSRPQRLSALPDLADLIEEHQPGSVSTRAQRALC